MATSGDVVGLFRHELAIGRNALQSYLHELREAGLVPSGGRGAAASHYGICPQMNLLLSVCFAPAPQTVARIVKAARAMPRDDSESKAFGNLTAANALTLGDALECLVDDAITGRLQNWKAESNGMFIDVVDEGTFVEIVADRSRKKIVFRREPVRATISALRVFRIDSRLFERIAEVLMRVESRDPKTGERILA